MSESKTRLRDIARLAKVSPATVSRVANGNPQVDPTIQAAVIAAAKKLGIDPVHFGIVIDVNMEVGLCHPPVGLNLYVASTIARLGITDLTKAVLPWLGTMFIFLIIVTYWPALTLFLPRLMGM